MPLGEKKLTPTGRKRPEGSDVGGGKDGLNPTKVKKVKNWGILLST